MSFRIAMALVALLLAAVFPSRAGLIAASTRVIFNEGQTQQSLMLVNTNHWPVMVQTWVDDGEANVNGPARFKAPFVAIPTLFSLEPKGMQGLRLVYNQQTLPKDRESVFWLNLYEMPPKSAAAANAQSVILTMNTQMKIFWRPKGLGAPENIAKKIRFSMVNNGKQTEIVCHNASPWHASFGGLALQVGDKTYAVEQQPDMMVAPYGEKRYTVAAEGLQATVLPLRINAKLIDDSGQVTGHTFPVR